jgi:hypothetical protein
MFPEKVFVLPPNMGSKRSAASTSLPIPSKWGKHSWGGKEFQAPILISTGTSFTYEFTSWSSGLIWELQTNSRYIFDD